MSETHGSELFSRRVAAGGRTYFLDVKRSVEGELYLKITESRAREDRFEHSRVMVFQDHLEPFIDGLRDAIMFCRKVIAESEQDKGRDAGGQGTGMERKSGGGEK